MIKKYTTAQGTNIDIDNLRLVNDTVIAVGNMSVNARGDLVAKDGSIKQTRNELMKDTYRPLNIPLLKTDTPVVAKKSESVPKIARPTKPTKSSASSLPRRSALASSVTESVAEPTLTDIPVTDSTQSLRGALASSVAPITLDPEFDSIDEEVIVSTVLSDLVPNTQPPKLKRI